MLRSLLTSSLIAFTLVLSACNPGSKTEPVEKVVTLQSAIDDPRRDQDRPRDAFRHPLETLEFFGVSPNQHVVEIWPGSYIQILAPYLKDNQGQYTAVLYRETVRTTPRNLKFKEKYSNIDVYGTINFDAIGTDTPMMMADGSADIVLTFRNVHNWMGGGYADMVFDEFYRVLKPGGTLGVVEHRLPESALQDPLGASGYVQESYIKALAKEAGFEFVASSEINANPQDTADHPFGVWTLPPRSRLPEPDSDAADGFDAQKYKNIGESDRATLKFRKPL